MQRRYELTLSMNYVKNWTYIEAFRELFQNAIDNEIQNPDNKMLFAFDEEKETIRICNKISKLEVETLLLGETTKADDTNTIGQHGEGYKVAFVVLLRENKTITVYNYGKREIWKVRAIKSKRYDNKVIPVVTIEKEAIWKKVPDNDLTIEVGNVTKDEYEQIKRKNLHLREEAFNFCSVENIGRALLDETESGNVYVKGLYINNVKGLKYGYDFEPSRIKLDRDRRLLDSIDVAWETSRFWSSVSVQNQDNTELLKLITQMVLDTNIDVKYMYHFWASDSLANDLARTFKKLNGHKAIPVVNNEQYAKAEKQGYNPIIAPESVAYLYKSATILHDYAKALETKTLKEELTEFISKVEGKLTDSELKEIESIRDRLNS